LLLFLIVEYYNRPSDFAKVGMLDYCNKALFQTQSANS
jgi:hypothetical protein